VGKAAVTSEAMLPIRTEAALPEQKALLEAAIEAMDQGVVVADADRRVSFFNNRVLDMLDLPRDWMAARPFLSEVEELQRSRGEYPDSGSTSVEPREQPGLVSALPVCERIRPNGSVIECRSMHLPDGGALRIYTDITSRRSAEVQRRQSEERHRALAAAGTSIVWQAAPDGSILECIGWEEFTGEPSQTAKGFGWLALMHPDDRQGTLAAWRTVLDSGETAEFRYRAKRRNGQYRWCEMRGAPLRSGDGTIREWIGTVTDVHGYKLAEEELIRSEERYRLLAEDATDIIARTDLNGIRRYLSPSSREWLGYEPDELIGTSIKDFIHPDDWLVVSSATDELVRGHAAHVTYTCRHLRKDGSWVWVEARRRLMRDDDGEPVGFVSFSRDVSERIRLEEQLRHSQKMEAIGELTGGVAHDFNNLLTVIVGNTEALTEDLTDPTHRALAKIALEAAERGAHLTRQLLAFGRRESLKAEPVALDDVVEHMMNLLKRTLGGHIQVRTEIGESTSAGLTDRGLLENAVLNLAVNARDAMPHGGTLTIQTGERSAGPNDGAIPVGQPVVFLTVADTGTGMPPEVLSRVFEPFFTTKEAGRGTGLGLSMVYGFAQQSGGHVSISSKPGQGTCVTIVLRAVGRAAHSLEPKAEPAPLPGQERVLVVEDEPSVRQFLSSQLKSLGYRVATAGAGPEALRLLRTDCDFDLLLTDVVLPEGMSGIELTKRARTIYPDLRVLLTSGYSGDVFKQHDNADRELPLLNKPYRRKELADMLRRVLDSDG
jgi:PAS domain S-box-containing protein